jgi:hypothetical protein
LPMVSILSKAGRLDLSNRTTSMFHDFKKYLKKALVKEVEHHKDFSNLL